MVSTWCHIMRTFDAPCIGIPQRKGLAYLSFGFNAIVRDGKIAKAYTLFDIIDLMHQAGFYPFCDAPGTAGPWPFPSSDTGASTHDHDPVRRAETLRIIREMQMGLRKPEEIKALAGKPGRHSPH